VKHFVKNLVDTILPARDPVSQAKSAFIVELARLEVRAGDPANIPFKELQQLQG
jgi:hypothetical protein